MVMSSRLRTANFLNIGNSLTAPERDRNLYEINKEMATDVYKCGRCKKRECIFYQLQTRSADEPRLICNMH